MKTLTRFLSICMLTPVLVTVNFEQALAEKLSPQTQDLVVTKLERVLSNMNEKSSTWVLTQQRLADVLSERARSRFMSEVEANCQGCKGSSQDRQRAIKIYESLLPRVEINEHGPILFHLAHLYEMAGNQNHAITLFEKIIKEAKKKNIKPSIVSKSRSSLGDLLFQKGRFKEAHAQYTIALKDKNLDNRALVIYNMAWCDFNEGKLSRGTQTLEGLLRNPQQITKETEQGQTYDAAFHTDIIRDLATFYTRAEIKSHQIATYEQLSPKDHKKSLLLHFAIEADRIGQKHAAHSILTRYLAQDGLTKAELLEAYVHMAQINYDRGQMTASTQDFAKAAALFEHADCKKTSKCEDLQKTMKRYVTELHRTKKLKPDQDLLNAYLIYNKTFPSDRETTTRGAQVAMDIQKYPVAVQLYRTISTGRGFSEKEKHEALLAEISAAEKSGDRKLQRSAYLHYLDNADNDGKGFEVRYQLAYLTYQEKNYKAATKALEKLAFDKKGRADLRKKSADLALDSLVQLKDEEELQDLALEFAKAFPQAQVEFNTIAHKALMNEVATIANGKSSTTSDFKKAVSKMKKTKVISRTNDEKILFATNLSVLAQKANDDEVYVESLQKLLNLPLSKERREETISQLASYYERKLDFKNAYRLALQVKAKRDTAESEFRLGTLADLAEMNPSRHYKAALKLGLKGSRSLVVRSRLVLLAKNPVNELKVQSNTLKQDPGLLNETALLVYAKTGNRKALTSVSNMKQLRNLSSAKYLAKQDFYTKLEKFAREINSHQLNAKNDSALQKSIKARIQLLKRADGHLTDAIRMKDITAQLWALNIVSSQNERMVRDLAALPLPKGLNPQEQAQYLDILKNQSKPYLTTARVAQQKQQEIWFSSAALAQLAHDYRTSRVEIQGLLSREMNILAQLPGEGKMKDSVAQALKLSPLSSRDLQSARKSVSESPANVSHLENLKLLETKMGHPLMPSYLEARLNHLQQGKSL